MGRPVSERLEEEVGRLSGRGTRPTLAVYLIGSDHSSRIYARSKVRKGESLGCDVLLRTFEEGVGAGEVEDSLAADAASAEIHGIMIERPLPAGLDLAKLMIMIPPEKDVEGLHPLNYGLMSLGRPRFIPPTPLGVLFMLLHHGVSLPGSRISVIGRSPNVGRPISLLLSQKMDWANSTVTLLHSGTRDPDECTKNADVVITSVGRARFLRRDMVKEGAVVIDVGINPDPDTGGITGDADMGSLDGWVSRITPTPGGTGPVTVSSIFINLLIARGIQEGRSPGFKDVMIRMIYDRNR